MNNESWDNKNASVNIRQNNVGHDIACSIKKEVRSCMDHHKFEGKGINCNGQDIPKRDK